MMFCQRNNCNVNLVGQDHHVDQSRSLYNFAQVLKMYTWEEPFQKRVLDMRQEELSRLWKYALLTATAIMISVHSPFMVRALNHSPFMVRTCTDIRPLHGTCMCTKSQTLHGTRTDTQSLHGSCTDTQPLYGTCTDSHSHHGTCTDIQSV